jgi:hypothetical protein
MICNLKTLGLMAVAALAMSATLASAAQATEGNGFYTCGKTPSTHTTCKIHGEQYGTAAENYLEFGGQKVTCENAGVTMTAHMPTGTSTHLTVTYHTKDCTAEGLPATVNMNGCTYTWTRPTTSGGFPPWDATEDLVCPAGQSIDIEVFLFGTATGSHSVNVCTMKVLPKNGLTNTKGGAGTKNGKDDLTVTTRVTNTKYEGSGSCGASAGENGVGSHNTTVTATGPLGELEDLWLSHSG